MNITNFTREDLALLQAAMDSYLEACAAENRRSELIGELGQAAYYHYNPGVIPLNIYPPPSAEKLKDLAAKIESAGDSCYLAMKAHNNNIDALKERKLNYHFDAIERYIHGEKETARLLWAKTSVELLAVATDPNLMQGEGMI